LLLQNDVLESITNCGGIPATKRYSCLFSGQT